MCPDAFRMLIIVPAIQAFCTFLLASCVPVDFVAGPLTELGPDHELRSSSGTLHTVINKKTNSVEYVPFANDNLPVGQPGASGSPVKGKKTDPVIYYDAKEMRAVFSTWVTPLIFQAFKNDPDAMADAFLAEFWNVMFSPFQGYATLEPLLDGVTATAYFGTGMTSVLLQTEGWVSWGISVKGVLERIRPLVVIRMAAWLGKGTATAPVDNVSKSLRDADAYSQSEQESVRHFIAAQRAQLNLLAGQSYCAAPVAHMNRLVAPSPKQPQVDFGMPARACFPKPKSPNSVAPSQSLSDFLPDTMDFDYDDPPTTQNPSQQTKSPGNQKQPPPDEEEDSPGGKSDNTAQGGFPSVDDMDESVYGRGWHW
ncbi:MAG: hypothetical protein M1825_003254 [Sarcosagium campestre]|nr:MAG: hypothetical protein M1825_003254 [Sarcosagium campestre]